MKADTSDIVETTAQQCEVFVDLTREQSMAMFICESKRH